MKSIRKQLKPISLFMTFLVLFVSCEQYDIVDEQLSLELYGEEYFKGIFFATGKVAEKVPSISNSFSFYELQKLNEDDSMEYHRKMEDIINEISKNDPDYFDEFLTSLKSRNHLTIQDALVKGSDILFKSAINLYFDKNQEKQLGEMVSKIDIDNYLTEDGSINYEELRTDIEKQSSFLVESEGKCWFAGIVFVAAAYVLVAHAAAAMTYVAIAWVGEYYAAIDRERTFNRGGGGGDGDEMYPRLPFEEDTYIDYYAKSSDSLSAERLINDLANLEY
ncbi:MAG: hypothetical protein ACON42_03535 [Flavobacteriaceae bacterium]